MNSKQFQYFQLLLLCCLFAYTATLIGCGNEAKKSTSTTKQKQTAVTTQTLKKTSSAIRKSADKDSAKKSSPMGNSSKDENKVTKAKQPAVTKVKQAAGVAKKNIEKVEEEVNQALARTSGKTSAPAQIMSASKIESETKEAIDSIRTFVQGTKDGYYKRIDATLVEFHTRLDELKTRANRLTDEAKSRVDSQTQQLEKNLLHASTELTQMTHENEKQLSSLSQRLSAALNNLEKGLEQAVEKPASQEVKNN